jgi:Zn-dependent oligopeptidase
MVCTGALFTTEDQAKYAKITEKLAKLCTVFTQVLLSQGQPCCFKRRYQVARVLCFAWIRLTFCGVHVSSN